MTFAARSGPLETSTITKRRLLSIPAMVTAFMSFNVVAEESTINARSEPVLVYSRLHADAEGVSHFGEDQISLSFENYAPPANPMAVHALSNSGPATFVLLARSAVENWHPSPRRQFAVILRGSVEVTAGDGEARRFDPGSILLLEDTTGTGHRTRVVGDDDNLALMIAITRDQGQQQL